MKTETNDNTDLLMQLEAITDTAIDGILTIDTRGNVCLYYLF
ncbi:MAG: hypothetical protein ACI9P5_002639 [Saprospiraceae bacterium]|jgi:hypothetical protein